MALRSRPDSLPVGSQVTRADLPCCCWPRGRRAAHNPKPRRPGPGRMLLGSACIKSTTRQVDLLASPNGAQRRTTQLDCLLPCINAARQAFNQKTTLDFVTHRGLGGLDRGNVNPDWPHRAHQNWPHQQDRSGTCRATRQWERRQVGRPRRSFGPSRCSERRVSVRPGHVRPDQAR